MSNADKIASFLRYVAEEEPLAADDSKSTTIDSALESTWNIIGRVHQVHMGMFISVMRIRFSWIIFFLIVVWLVSDLILVYAAAFSRINVWEIYGLVGAGGGCVIGWLCSSF